MKLAERWVMTELGEGRLCSGERDYNLCWVLEMGQVAGGSGAKGSYYFDFTIS